MDRLIIGKLYRVASKIFFAYRASVTGFAAVIVPGHMLIMHGSLYSLQTQIIFVTNKMNAFISKFYINSRFKDSLKH